MDQSGYRFSTSATDRVLGGFLIAKVGSDLAARATGVRQARTVRDWRDGVRDIRGQRTRDRARIAMRAVFLIDHFAGKEAARAWISAPNPSLGDRSPADVLGDSEDVTVDGPAVVAAANSFASDIVAEARRESASTPRELALEVGPGWKKLAAKAVADIREVEPEATIAQVKEKFGELRIYLINGTEPAREIARATEEQAARTCMMCGKETPDVRNAANSRGWWTTLCDVDRAAQP